MKGYGCKKIGPLLCALPLTRPSDDIFSPLFAFGNSNHYILALETSAASCVFFRAHVLNMCQGSRGEWVVPLL